MSLDSVTYGGQSMTKITDEIVGTDYQAYVAAYILNEADINNATSGTFVPNWSDSTPYDTSYSSVFLENVDQTTPIGADDANEATSSTPNPVTTDALSTSDGDMVILGATCGNAGTGDLYDVNGFDEAIEHIMYSSSGVTGYKTATGASETPSAEHDNPNRQVIIGFVVQSSM